MRLSPARFVRHHGVSETGTGRRKPKVMNTEWVALLPLLAATTVLGLATAQEVVVCPTGDPDQCVTVDPQAPPEVPMPPDMPQAPAQAGQAWLEWRPAQEVVDPLFQAPGVCAQSSGRARYRFSQAMLSGDLNKIIGAYQWRGKVDEQADPIIERLAALPPQGQWEQSAIGMWSGPDDTPKKVPVYWRWSDGTSTTYFSMQKVDGCWFVEFSSNPGESVVIEGSSVRQAPVTSPAPEAEPTTEPDNPDVLVF